MTLAEFKKTIPPEHLLWIQKVYEKTKGTKKCNHRKLLVELKDELPGDFRPSQISPELYVSNDQDQRFAELKLLGIYIVDPKSDLIKQVDVVIKNIKEKLIEDPNQTHFTASNLADELKFHTQDVIKILGYLQDIGNFWNSAQGNPDSYGFRSIKIERESSFVTYLHYTNIKKQINSYLGRNSLTESYSAQVPSISKKEYQEEVYKDTVFIMMHMDRKKPELVDIKNAIKEICELFGLNAVRADDIEHQDKITDVILEHIRKSEFLIADLTSERPNVYYEIGYAHSLNKKPILYRKKGTPLHFDLLVHNVPEYENITDLKKQLTSRFEAILGRKAK